MKRIRSDLALATALLALAGCAQMKGDATPPAAKAERAIIPGSFTEPYADCNRGLVKTLIYRDWINGDGKVLARGKAILVKKPLNGISPNYLLGEEPKIRGTKAPKTSGIEYMDLGDVFSLNFGASADGDPNALIATGDEPDDPPLAVELERIEDEDTKYITYAGTAELSEDLFEEEENDGPPAANGVGSLRTLAIRNEALGSKTTPMAIRIPSDVESKGVSFQEGLKPAPALGGPIAIPVTPSTPSEGIGWFTVVVSEASDAPKWAYTYRVEDKGQKRIEVPTKWAGPKGEEAGMKAANKVWIRVNRSQMVSKAMPDGGNVCFETAAGTMFKSSITDPNAKK